MDHQRGRGGEAVDFGHGGDSPIEVGSTQYASLPPPHYISPPFYNPSIDLVDDTVSSSMSRTTETLVLNPAALQFSILPASQIPLAARYSAQEALNLAATYQDLDDSVSALLAGLRQDIFISQSSTAGDSSNVASLDFLNGIRALEAHQRALVLHQANLLPPVLTERWMSPGCFTSIAHRVRRTVRRERTFNGIVIRLMEGRCRRVVLGERRERDGISETLHRVTLFVSVERTGTRTTFHGAGDLTVQHEFDDIVYIVTCALDTELGRRSDRNLRRFIESHIDFIMWRPRHLEACFGTGGEEHAVWAPLDDANDEDYIGPLATLGNPANRRSRSISAPVPGLMRSSDWRRRSGSWSISERRQGRLAIWTGEAVVEQSMAYNRTTAAAAAADYLDRLHRDGTDAAVRWAASRHIALN